jgi:ankyrin repeat protein
MNDDCPPLIHAINTNNISYVKSLIAGGSVDVNAIDNLSNPMLLLAAKLGHVEIVALLLDAGARINDVNDFDDSACHAAVRNGHIRVVELLTARRANVSLQNGANETPITMAMKKKNNERVLMMLIDAAIANGTLDDAIRDSYDRTPLHVAVWHRCDSTVIDTLIGAACIDVDIRDRDGFTAIHTACLMHNIDAVTRFVAAGANLELTDKKGDTPLHYGRFDSKGQFTELLLAAGANVHARNNSGNTACHLACQMSHRSLPALLAFGADLDEPDNDGVTPRQLLMTSQPTTEEIAQARRRVLNVRLSLVRGRAIDICVALQSRNLDALCMCEILIHSCEPVAPIVPFHKWWEIATKVKHWRQQ